MKKKILLFYFLLANLLLSQTMINEIMTSNTSVLFDEDGETSDWIEIYNSSSEPINLEDYSITDDENDLRKWIFPNYELAPFEYLIVFASDKNKTTNELHTNFKISSEGENILLVDNYGFIVDQYDSTVIPTNFSLGRNLEDQSELLLYQIPTPGTANTTSGYANFSEDPIFSIEGGFNTSSVNLTLTTESGLANIYYTSDGSDPTIYSDVYTGPISINSTTVIKARTFTEDFLPSKIVTHTYLINEISTLPIISLSTNPDNFFDEEIGIYVEGTNGIPGYCLDTPANWNHDWERPIHIEFFENTGDLAFSMDAGVAIDGGCTRRFPQKTLAINARVEYGSKVIPYSIFPDLPYNEYSSIILRNSGNDYASTMIRDALMHDLVKELDLETKAYRPAIVFLNGEYFGIHNIREKHNHDYILQRYEIENDSIDMLVNSYSVVEGTNTHYLALFDFISNNDLSLNTNYEYVKTQIDVENYITYLLLEMYCVNWDWYPNNTRFWRPQSIDGRWRWILYDTDYGFGFSGLENTVNYNMFRYIKKTDRFPSFLINGLLQNRQFKTKFLNKFADLSNSVFKPSNVISNIDILQNGIISEIERHINYWHSVPSYNDWLSNVEVLRQFGNNRIVYMWEHFVNDLNLLGKTSITIDLTVPSGGLVTVNSLKLTQFPWSGEYFMGIPITLEALPKPGYKFVGWAGDTVSANRIISYFPKENNIINAIFELDDQIYPVVINEINYNSPVEDDGEPNRSDWIELYNNSDDRVDLSGWQFKDDGNSFVFPNGIQIDGREYLVIAENDSVFQFYYPSVTNLLDEGFGFGLSNGGEEIALYSLSETLVDTIDYNDKAPWPIEPDGNGPTLELVHPDLDNNKGLNWRSSDLCGSPGSINKSYRNIYDTVDIPDIVINEINYNSPDVIPARPNWIELYNNTEQTVDLSRWQFKDEDYTFIIPGGTILNPDEYLVLADTVSNFQFYYPSVTNLLNEGFGFGLSGGGELLRLYNSESILVDLVDYDDEAPWPTEPDEGGPTLELIYPDSNNIIPENWMASLNPYGTPGSRNSVSINEFLCDVQILSLNPSEDKIELRWNACRSDAFGYYAIYRFKDFNQIADSLENYTYSTVDTFFTDTDVSVGNTYYYQIAAFDSNGFRGSYSEKAFVLVTDVKQNDLLRTNFELFQNYPNPFNPITKISYQFPELTNGSIRIFNTLGEEIYLYEIENQKPGYYEIEFDGSKLSSGIYFCLLKTDKYNQIQKMILLK